MSEISSLEYQSLRQELLQNERYVFETLFLIFAAFSTAFIALYDKSLTIDLLLPFILICLLDCNLQIIKTKVYNNARIAAYISLVLEPKHRIEWIGWENALQLYRTPHPYKNYRDEKQKGTTSLFWPHIYHANVLFVFFADAVSIITTVSWIRQNTTTYNIQFDWILIVPILILLFTIIISCIFLSRLIDLDRSMKTKDLIHEQKNQWLSAFGKDDETCIAPDKNER